MRWLDKTLAKFRGKVDLTEPVEEAPEVTPNRAMRRAQQRQVKRMVAKKWTIPYHQRMQRYDNALEAHRRRLARLSPERLAVLAKRAEDRRLDEAIQKGD